MNIESMTRPFLKDVRPYKPGKPIELVQRERKTTAEFVKLASNENPYPPHPKVKEAVMAMMEEANRYPESGCYLLVRDLAKDLGVNEDQVFVGNGSNEIIDLLMRAFAFPDENCVFATPSFIVYDLVCRIADVKGISIPCTDYKIDLQEISKAVNEKTKFVFICNPNNPTGTYFTADELDAFLASIPEHVMVVLDEAYYEYVKAPDYPDTISLQKKRNTILVLRTFSKMYSLAGFRIGYAIADEKIVEALHKVRQPFNVNRLAQAAARAALQYKDDIKKAVDEAIEERDRLRKIILELGCGCPPSQTNFLYVVLPNYEGDICEKFLDNGVIVRNVVPFGGEKNCFRVTIGTPPENNKFIDVFRKVLKS